MIYPSNFEQKIGFDQIRHILQGRCLSTLGKDKVEEMQFSPSHDEVKHRLEEVEEFVRIWSKPIFCSKLLGYIIGSSSFNLQN